jgi:hypothetical protein
LRKIPVERRKISRADNRIYLLNSAEYLTASKQWHASRFRASDHLDHLIFKTFINLRKQEKSFQRSVFPEQTRK